MFRHLLLQLLRGKKGISKTKASSNTIGTVMSILTSTAGGKKGKSKIKVSADIIGTIISILIAITVGISLLPSILEAFK